RRIPVICRVRRIVVETDVERPGRSGVGAPREVDVGIVVGSVPPVAPCTVDGASGLDRDRGELMVGIRRVCVVVQATAEGPRRATGCAPREVNVLIDSSALEL